MNACTFMCVQVICVCVCVCVCLVCLAFCQSYVNSKMVNIKLKNDRDHGILILIPGFVTIKNICYNGIRLRFIEYTFFNVELFRYLGS